MTWTYHNPTRVCFGAGALAGLGSLVAGRRYVLVTYGEPVFAPLVRQVGDLAGTPLAVFDRVTANPDFTALAPACEEIAPHWPDIELFVALGGGSVIDAAKVLAASAGDFAKVRRYLETGEGGEALAPKPILAVPTTAGTGSEVTSWATVWNSEAGRKFSLNLPGLYPECALVDPDLTLGLPRGLTVATGLDALSHALEAIWNRNANPISTDYAVAAARLVLATLPKLADDLGNRTLRTNQARAAVTAGLAFSNTKTALAHSLSYSVTLNHGAAHGIACSFSLPFVMRGAIGVDEACDAGLKRIFGDDLEAGADSLELFLDKLGVGCRPRDHGVGPEEWRGLVAEALEGERGRNFLGSPERLLDNL